MLSVIFSQYALIKYRLTNEQANCLLEGIYRRPRPPATPMNPQVRCQPIKKDGTVTITGPTPSADYIYYILLYCHPSICPGNTRFKRLINDVMGTAIAKSHW